MTTTISDRRTAPRTRPTEKKFFSPDTEIKAIDDAARTFEGYSATWDIDLGDDQIVKGAFAKTIEIFKSGKKRIPLIDNHNYYRVLDSVGTLVDAREDDRGLWSKWRVGNGNTGDEILHRLRDGIVNKMSIGYHPVAYEYVTEERNGKDRRIRLLKEINWDETSLVIFPMNEQADIDLASVKAMLGRKDLNDDERAQLEMVRDEIDAILAGPAADDTPAPKGLAPDDPKRLEVEALLRDIAIRSLATR